MTTDRAISHPEGRVYQSLASKAFVILTGNSGTGKTRLAQRLCASLGNAPGAIDPFRPGAAIQSERIQYHVEASDSLSVEFWNSRDSETSTRVVLPRVIIEEWVECIRRESFGEEISCRRIRETVSKESRFSSQLHSFETHLKAAAFAVINSRVTDAQSEKTVELVSVGADWTDNRAVVGFVNHLRSAELNSTNGQQPVYQSTGVLDLLLAANNNPAWPYFLILDEMNLSHVERYFADFLSAMEARNGTIRLHDEGPRDADDFRLPRYEGDTLGVPREIGYPTNLFVIGTVNVDETTYMFSPKVLDRAHVIEFQVSAEDIGTFLNDPKELAADPRGGEAEAKAFLRLARDSQTGKLASLESPSKMEINGHLLNLLSILQRARFEFAYRTANEVTRYLRVCRHLAKDKVTWDSGGWENSLDDEILQKILPRLHGSRNRLGALLGALTCYTHTGSLQTATEYFPAEGSDLPAKSIGDSEFLAMNQEGATFPRSFNKLKTMAGVLVEEQFVSFIC